MIDLGTLAGLHEHRHQLAAYCPRCDSWRLLSLAHARAVIEAWRQEYNDERPKRSLGGLTPSQYAKQLAARPLTMPADSRPTCY